MRHAVSDILPVHLTVDVGPADAVLGRGTDVDADWSATLRGAELLLDMLARLSNEWGQPVGSTWFNRADRLVEAQFGDRLAIIERFATLAGGRDLPSVETGWMPQLYGAGSTAVDYDDLHLTHARLTVAGHAPHSVRMGNCFHDNRTMATLAALGVALDSSALPGRIKIEAGWRLDWSATPQHAFRPARADYRRPGVPALDILEVPLSMIPIKADYDRLPLARYANPAMWPSLLWPALAHALAGTDRLVLIVHPDEIVAGRHGAGHPLISYSAATCADNLRRLRTEAARFGRCLRFMPLRDIVLSAADDKTGRSR